MKRKGELFARICSFENLYLAWEKARRAKPSNVETIKFGFNLEDNLFSIQEEIKKQNYEQGKYKRFMVRDPKLREIWAAPFKDRVIHHAICNIIEPIFDRTFIDDSYACRKGKGSHKAVVRLNCFLQNPENKYCLKCDISKYFQSIDHNILMRLIERKIKDKKVLCLIGKILNSMEKGIPIGNLTSQLFANIYLNPLDYFVKHSLKAKYYIRYVDDFVILGRDVKILEFCREKIKSFLETNLKLKLKTKKMAIFPVKHGIDFLGFRVYKTHRKIRKSSIVRFRKKLKKMKRNYCSNQKSLEDVLGSISSYFGHWKWADTYNLRAKLLEV